MKCLSMFMFILAVEKFKPLASLKEFKFSTKNAKRRRENLFSTGKPPLVT